LEKGFIASGLSPEDRRWITELVLGSTRWKRRLDWEIRQFFKGPYNKVQHSLKAALRMGLYQIRFMDTPDHAAVHATVEMAKKKIPRSAVGLLNAVLRKLSENRPDPETMLLTDIERLAIGHSHPDWLIERWLDRYGPEDTSKLCRWNNSAPKIWLRVNTLQISVDDFLMEAEALGALVSPSDVLPGFVEIDHVAPLIRSKLYDQGKFWIQDLAAGMVPHLLDPGGGELILDPCAAPGGKSLQLAVLTGGKAMIRASDSSAERLKRLGESIGRLNLEGIQIDCVDARRLEYDDVDKILLDIPCTGTGVLHRRADSRWKKDPQDIIRLTNLQLEIAEHAWSRLRSGGLMVYSTCTLEPEENWDLVNELRSRHPEIIIEPVDNPELQDYVDAQGALALEPWRHALDGMFAVKLRKP